MRLMLAVIIFSAIFLTLLVQVLSAQTSSVQDETFSNGSYIRKVGSRVVLPPEKSRPVVIPKFDVAPVIDGILDDEVWQRAAVFRDFYQTSTGDNIEPSKPTIV